MDAAAAAPAAPASGPAAPESAPAQAAAEASLVTAKDNLKYTTITAAIDGLVGVTKYTAGNFVTPSSGPILTIIQMQPIRVRFSMSTGDFLSGYGSLTALKK